MKIEDRKLLRARMPEAFKKASIVGGIGCAIGAGIGGYISVIKGNYIYAGIGAGLGSIIGEVIGLLIHRKIPSQPLTNTEKRMNVVSAVLSLLLAIGGIILFLSRGRWEGIAGAIFFGLGGIYLLKKK